ncbi:MAG: hypothetical protein Q3966_08340 [Neisseria sp.]|nr:hypothetical protein [Neisseria sp.]
MERILCFIPPFDSLYRASRGNGSVKPVSVPTRVVWLVLTLPFTLLSLTMAVGLLTMVKPQDIIDVFGILLGTLLLGSTVFYRPSLFPVRMDTQTEQEDEILVSRLAIDLDIYTAAVLFRYIRIHFMVD